MRLFWDCFWFSAMETRSVYLTVMLACRREAAADMMKDLCGIDLQTRADLQILIQQSMQSDDLIIHHWITFQKPSLLQFNAGSDVGGDA